MECPNLNYKLSVSIRQSLTKHYMINIRTFFNIKRSIYVESKKNKNCKSKWKTFLFNIKFVFNTKDETSYSIMLVTNAMNDLWSTKLYAKAIICLTELGLGAYCFNRITILFCRRRNILGALEIVSWILMYTANYLYNHKPKLHFDSLITCVTFYN